MPATQLLLHQRISVSSSFNTVKIYIHIRVCKLNHMFYNMFLKFFICFITYFLNTISK